MYLSDRDIRAKIETKQLVFECENGIQPFDIERQITPCSIDLRLSNTFWKANKKIIDIKNPFDNNMTQSVYWRKIIKHGNDCITLKPGESILGRTHESITIPMDCAGKIESRSGMNRLSILVTLGDFCNPGFIGHYPLQIINMGTHTIKLYPYISICQLVLIPLTSIPTKNYNEDLNSNYSDGIGGPSKYWADRVIKGFKQETYGEINNNVDEIIKYTNAEDVIPIIKNFQKYYIRNKSRYSHDDIYLKFVKSEKAKKNVINILRYAIIPAAMLSFAGFCGLNLYNMIYNNVTQGIKLNIAFLTFNSIGIIVPVILGIFFIIIFKNMVFYIPNKTNVKK